MKELKLVRILDFYDEIQLFTAKDAVGCMYLCQLYESTADGSDYLCVAISQDRLDSFLKGILDLREALTQPEISDQYYKVVMKKDVIQAFDLAKNDVQESMLPEEGYFFEPDEQTEDIDMIRESENCGSPLIRLALEDEKNGHEVSAECLSGVLAAYRNLLNSCYKKRNDKEVLKLDVVALKAASFDIHFKVDTSFDLLMDTPLINELSAIDDLFCFEDIESYKSKAVKFKGRILNSFVLLLNFLKENKLSLRHKWVKSLTDGKVQSRYTPFRSIAKMCDFLESENDLCKEIREFCGVFLASSVEESGKWTMRCEKIDGEPKTKDISGTSSDPQILSGVTIEQKHYRIQCEEIQTIKKATMKVTKKYILVKKDEIES